MQFQLFEHKRTPKTKELGKLEGEKSWKPNNGWDRPEKDYSKWGFKSALLDRFGPLGVPGPTARRELELVGLRKNKKNSPARPQSRESAKKNV